MGFSSLYSPSHLSYSPPSLGSPQYSTSSSGAGSTPKHRADDWNLAVGRPGLYNNNICTPATPGFASSSYGDLGSPVKKAPTSHPLLQACAASSSTTSLTSLTHVPNLRIVAPPITQSGRVSYLANAAEPEESLLGGSAYSQPSGSINILKNAANAITPAALIKLLEEEPQNVLLFDIRPDRAYEAGHICQAINVPIPMKKLKKTSFTLDRMITDFVLDGDLEKVASWNQVSHIVVYDNDRDGQSGIAGSATFYLLEKFIQEGWKGQTYVLKGEYTSINHISDPSIDFGITGGIDGFAEDYPGKIQEIHSISCMDFLSNGSENLFPRDLGDNSPGVLAYANQRDILRDWKLSSENSLPRNRDSWDEVDEIAITIPLNMGGKAISLLPPWLSKACENGGSKLVAEKFQLLEKLQVQRLNGTYSTSLPSDTLGHFEEDPARYRLASSCADAKNRYRDIYPYEHSRVKLLDFQEEDYINASHLSVQNSSKKYILSQAPTPAAFDDFWKMVWEQDVRFIVVLTAMEEAFRTVAHRYWASGNYGPLRLTCMSEKMILLNDIPRDAWQGAECNKPIMHYISVRRFTLEHEAYPFFAIRGITQIQDLAWPDFGVPDDPAHILRIISYVNQSMGSIPPVQYLNFDCYSPCPKPPQKPIVVQCSAGCGRSGVFCTVDAVVDQLERHLTQQGNSKKEQEQSGDDSGVGKILVGDDYNEETRRSGYEDLIEKVVGQFRDERMSAVQNLRQYMYCYEVTLEWFRIRCMEGK